MIAAHTALMRYPADPSVSVIIPAFNCERFVAEAIQSAIDQTIPPHEIIVVDDGSTDGTLEALQRFGPQVRLLTQRNQGPSLARNRGAAAATGAWLAFLDADDTWLPTKLQRQLETAADSDVAMVYTNRLNIGARGTLPEVQSEVQRLYAGDVFIDLLLGNHVSLSSVMIRTDLFRSLNGFAGHIRAGEDWDLWIRFAESHRVGLCTEPLVRYRFHGQMSSGNPWHMRDGRNEVIRRALDTQRGRVLPAATRRRVLASVAMTNARDASKRRAWQLAFIEYGRAAWRTPGDLNIYGEFLRFVGRIILRRPA